MFEGHIEWADEQKAVLDTIGLTRMTMGIPYTATGQVWFAQDKAKNEYTLKLIYKDSYEIKALEKMRSLPSPRNRVIPGRLYECQDAYVFVMPFLDIMGYHWAAAVSWESALDNLAVLIDSVRFMHENNIAFVDISTGNLVWTSRDVSFGGFNIPKGEVFLIDFGSARVLPAGPGSGLKIHEFKEHGGKWEPSEGFDAVDPYTYDIYCLGRVLLDDFSNLGGSSRDGLKIEVSQVWFHFAATLTVREPSRRPPIACVCRQFAALRTWTSHTAWIHRIWPCFAGNFEYYGWRVISMFIH